MLLLPWTLPTQCGWYTEINDSENTDTYAWNQSLMHFIDKSLCLAPFKIEKNRRRRHITPSTKKFPTIDLTRTVQFYKLYTTRKDSFTTALIWSPQSYRIMSKYYFEGDFVEICRLRRLYCFLIQLENIIYAEI